MPERSREVHAPNDPPRGAGEFLVRLRRSGRPVVLTINGNAELVVRDAESFQGLLALVERIETIEAVKEGLASADRGEGRPPEEFFEDLERELKATADS